MSNFLTTKILIYESQRETFDSFFISRKRENTISGLVPVYARITINEDRKAFSSGQQCLATDWCNKRKSVIAKTTEARAVNNELTEIKATLVKLYDVLELQGKTVSSGMLREESRKSRGLLLKSRSLLSL